MSHPNHIPRTESGQAFDSHMQAIRRGLKAAQAYGLPPVRVTIPRSGFDKRKGRLVRFLDESGEVHSEVLLAGNLFNIRTLIVMLFERSRGMSAEDAGILFDTNQKPETEDKERVRYRDDWQPIISEAPGWKTGVNAANRRLALVCQIHGLPLLRLHVHRRYSERYLCDVVYADTRKPVPETIAPRGFFLECEGAEVDSQGTWYDRRFVGDFNPQQIAL